MGKEIKTFNNVLKEKGYKITAQRQAVLDIIEQNKGDHLNTQEIHELVKKDCPDIGIATVYRTLLLLEKMHMVDKINLDDGFARYELSRDNKEHGHHHLICLSCGTVDEFKDDLLDKLEEKIENTKNFMVIDHSVKIYGYCKKCKKQK